MFEASKTRALRGPEFEERYFRGRILDVGAGPDLVTPDAQSFDMEHGDANRILDYLPRESFDCVHSSHCLEHMFDPRSALSQWWALVKPGGYLVVVVPDEDLYEQGIWPSMFNSDHKASFRLDKETSTMPMSYDLRELARGLPECEVIDICVQDKGYDYRLRRRGRPATRLMMFELRLFRVREKIFGWMMRRGIPVYRIGIWCDWIERFLGKPIDQTAGSAIAQIQLVARKQKKGDARQSP